MSDTPGQAGGEGGAAPPTELSESQVMAGIEGLLGADDGDERPRRQRERSSQTQPAQTPPQEAAEDTGQDPAAGPDDPATGDDEEEPPASEDGDDAEPSDQHVAPPDSWNAADKEVFQQLPPEAQAVIARRESERDKLLIRKSTEIDEHRRAIEATVNEIQTERQSYAQNLQQLLYVAAPEAQKFASIDWQRLATENPADYVRLSAERDAMRGRIGAIQGELQRVAQQAEQGQAQQLAVLRQVEYQKLVEALPDFGDPEKGPKLKSDMQQWLRAQGFSDAEIGQVVDSRVLVVAEKAMRADRAATVRRQAETKRTTAAATVQPPGAGRQRSDTQAAQRRNQKMAQLRKSGSEKDAISYLLDVL